MSERRQGQKSMLELEDDNPEGASVDADPGPQGAKNDPKPGNHPTDDTGGSAGSDDAEDD